MQPTKPSSQKRINAKTSQAETERLVALTLKIDSKTYMRLSMLRAKERKTAQDILTEALKAYLDRAGE